MSFLHNLLHDYLITFQSSSVIYRQAYCTYSMCQKNFIALRTSGCIVPVHLVPTQQGFNSYCIPSVNCIFQCNIIHFTVSNTVKCVVLCISTSFCILGFHICFHKNNHVKMAFFIEEYLVVVCIKNYIQKFRRIVQSIFSHFKVSFQSLLNFDADLFNH